MTDNGRSLASLGMTSLCLDDNKKRGFMQELVLKKNEERRLQAGHLWIYSNEIDPKFSPLKKFTPGEIVEIKTASHRILGSGYINPNTLLCARLLTSNPQEEINLEFFVTRIKQALICRNLCFDKPFYRLIFGESDQLPGLIVDRFDDVLVAQLNTAGIENLKELIVEALIHVIKPTSILLRNNSPVRTTENLTSYVEAAYGENRNVLDVFSYSGSFGITAAVNNAQNVTCIDSSEPALEQVRQNAELNKVSDKVTSICADAFSALKDLHADKKLFDVIILDPPAFIKRQKDITAGTEAYLRLQRLALNILQSNGILVTTSCS